MTHITPDMHVPLGSSDTHVSPIGLGTMTFGEQVGEQDAHAIMDRAVARGVNFLDTAEIYPVPPNAATYGATEAIIGSWLARRTGLRQQVFLASKVAGPSRGMPWVRENQGLSAADIQASCHRSLRRLQTDVIDLYQIHWPVRAVPIFGNMYYEPKSQRDELSIHAQLTALAQLVQAGKVRYIGVSNETPYGVHEFVRLAQQHGLPHIVSVQNPYCLSNRSFDNGLDETCHRLNVSLLAYSPLGFGVLSGKYDATGIFDAAAPTGRMSRYERMQSQRWGRPGSLAVAKRYNQLARDHGFTPTQLALAFCYRSWRVTSTLIGVTTLAQLDENIDAWTVTLSPELVAACDAIRQEARDPAQ